jgi:hypothetical protein
MKRYSLLSALLVTPFLLLAEQTIVLSGVYQGSDLYVQNPFSGQGVSFCVFEVRVNGDVTSDEVNSSAFAIDFEVLGLRVGDDVEVMINHKNGCTPRVLNPEVLNPRSTFEVTSIEVDAQGVLSWSTKNEAGELPYFIEQFRWNKWVKAGEVAGVGKPGEHQYQFKLIPHSGTNRIRVRQTDYRGEIRTSEEVEFAGPSKAVTFEPEKPKDVITFSSPTSFEIFDRYGQLVMKGYDNKLEISELEKGEYYINYDNSFGSTFKKR